MKILLFGATGQLGTELRSTLAPLGELASFGVQTLNLENAKAIRETVRAIRPDVLVNASAYTAVDQAESEPEKAYRVNADAPGLLAAETARLDALLIHYSTDYVFDGSKGSPYVEADLPNPLSTYGKSKLAGEQAIQAGHARHLLLRTSWVYSLNRNSFVNKVLEWARRQEVLNVVSDQISNPTWARTLAQVTAHLLEKGTDYLKERRGLYHVSGSGYISRFDWARKIVELDPRKGEQKVREIRPALTSDFPTPAQRPLFSALDCSLVQSTFEFTLPRWEDDLLLAMAEMPS